MLRTAGHPKLHALAGYSDIDLTVLVPDEMIMYGGRRIAEAAENPAFRYVIGKARWQYLGKQIYLMHYRSDLARLLREIQPDVLDIWEEPWSLTSAQAIWLARHISPQTRIVVETEQNIFKRLPPPFQQFQNYSLRHAHYLVGRSQEALEVAQQKGYRGPAEVVGNAVDPTLFRPLDRAVCRRELGLEGFVAGYVGRMVESKGLGDMVEALPLCPEEVRLLFVGDGPYRAVLERRAQQLSVSGRVRFLENRPREALPQLMNAIDVLTLVSHTTASWKEQFGRVIIEAHACRTPVIGSDSGAIPEVVGEGGLIVPERSPRALAEAFCTLQASPERCAELGERGYARALAHYTWEQVAGQMRQVYQRVLHPASAPNAALEKEYR
jgi:glycosyltransferase involved in cell wall biosynthesis